MAKLSIASIQDVQMQTIAKSVDTNNDGILKKEEFNLFAQEATKAGIDYQTISETLGLNGFQRWINDVDKVCTDGKDDGKLAFGEKMESFGKGLAGLVKGAINKPILTAATVVAGAGLVALTGGAILPVMIAAGATMGVGMIGVGAYKAAKADNDADAKRAWETIGTGTFTVGASLVGAKTSLNQANKAGVISAKGVKDMSAGKALVQNFKSVPEALKVSGLNAKGNIQTWMSAIQGENVIYAHSNKLREGIVYDLEYKKDGYSATTTLNEDFAKLPAKELEAIFWGKETDIPMFKTIRHNYGQGTFKVFPEGTKINTAEGLQVIQKGQIVFMDQGQNPQIINVTSDFTKNIAGITTQAQEALLKTQGVKLVNQYLERDYCYPGGKPEYGEMTISVNGKNFTRSFWDMDDMYNCSNEFNGQSWLLSNIDDVKGLQ